MQDMSAVIGANFGDEGKGLVTDYLATPNALVVRFNGGSQAGHTVTEPDGRRHVFHHFGSGSLRGAATYLTRDFLVNPITFAEEHKELKGKAIRPTVYIDPSATVTTPWDMLLNQAVEKKRGNERHGSCGLGIHETVVRNRVAPLRFSDLFNTKERWVETLTRIRDVYVQDRTEELGVVLDPVSQSQNLLERFSKDVDFLVSSSVLRRWDGDFVSQWENVIFEGAQGLRLDEKSSYFPHVTCSKTGLSNVADLLEDVGLWRTPLKVYYCTRPYITRHGAGPLGHELPYSPYKKVKDATNIPNPWQGTIRYGRFDMDEFSPFVRADWTAVKDRLRVSPHLALTCLDQIDNSEVDFVICGVTRTRPWSDFAEMLIKDAGLAADGLVSFGPTRKEVRPFKSAVRESGSFA